MIVARRRDELRLAAALLTRLPVGRIEPCPPVGAASWAFSLAGALPGLACGIVLWGALALGVPSLAAAFAGLGAGAMVTGGLHEDGLADFVDGLSGGRNPARRLEIMRDSRIGSHGALALIVTAGIRASALAALGGAGAVAGPLAAAMLARGGVTWLLVCLPPARADGLGFAAGNGAGAGAAAVATLIGLAAALPLGIGPAVLCAGAGAAAIACIGFLAHRRIGGHTGDVLGAAILTAETAALMVLAACGT